MKDGFGELMSKDQQLTGEWAKNIIVEGFLVKDKKIYFGQFQHQKKHGRGITIWSDGSFYDGEFVENKKEGKGSFVASDGSAKCGTFVKDKPEGEIFIVLVDGRCRVALYKNGEKSSISEQTIEQDTDEEAKKAVEQVK